MESKEARNILIILIIEQFYELFTRVPQLIQKIKESCASSGQAATSCEPTLEMENLGM